MCSLFYAAAVGRILRIAFCASENGSAVVLERKSTGKFRSAWSDPNNVFYFAFTKICKLCSGEKMSYLISCWGCRLSNTSGTNLTQCLPIFRAFLFRTNGQHRSSLRLRYDWLVLQSSNRRDLFAFKNLSFLFLYRHQKGTFCRDCYKKIGDFISGTSLVIIESIGRCKFTARKPGQRSRYKRRQWGS